MEVFLLVVLFFALILIIDGLCGSGGLFLALRAGARYLRRRHPHVARWLGLGDDLCDPQRLNDPAGALVGRIAVVEQEFVAGRGRVAIDGTTWSATGPDLAAGTRVRIAGARETVLVVEPDT